MKKYLILYLFLQCFIIQISYAQKKHSITAVAFYNLENLFDTERDTRINDEEFTPTGKNSWTLTKYQKKLANMASVIKVIGTPYTSNGPALLGVAEIENRKVLEDLVAQPDLKDKNYGIVHYDSPDRRGIDVALLYQKDQFKVSKSATFAYRLDSDTTYKTRDVLLVEGTLINELVYILVNHWPSRYGGKSSVLREQSAAMNKKIVDSLYQVNNQAKVIIMGDLNDDPTDVSCRVVLNAKKTQAEVQPGGLFNTMWSHFERGIGSLCYQDKWNLFDQIIISESLLGKDRSSLKFWKSEIFNRDFITQQEGKYKGYPHRTFSAGMFVNGYSDHFPTLIYLVKELKVGGGR